MSYGWLSETTLALKKPKAIKISDKSNEPLRSIIKERLEQSKKNTCELHDPKHSNSEVVAEKGEGLNKKSTSKPDSNRGVAERDKRDKEFKRERGYKKQLIKKAEIYKKLESGDSIDDKEAAVLANSSLVDFKRKNIQSQGDAKPLPSGGALCMYSTHTVIPASHKSNIDDLRAKLAKIKQSNKSTFQH